MSEIKLKPESLRTLLDAIDRLKDEHAAQDSAVAHDKLCHEPKVKAAGDSLIQKVLMVLEGICHDLEIYALINRLQ